MARTATRRSRNPSRGAPSPGPSWRELGVAPSLETRRAAEVREGARHPPRDGSSSARARPEPAPADHLKPNPERPRGAGNVLEF